MDRSGLPPTFLTFICVCYFMIAPYNVGGLSLPSTVSYITGVAAALGLFTFFVIKTKKLRGQIPSASYKD